MKKLWLGGYFSKLEFKLMKRFILILIALLPVFAQAQAWQYKTEIKPSKNGGFHESLLPPELTCHLALHGSNLRVLDEAGSEIPYLFESDSWSTEEASIQWMPKTGKDDWRRHYSRSFFMNDGNRVIDRMALKIRNADVHQGFWLSGSDDMSDWYIIKENFDYYANYDAGSTWNLVTIHFPPTDYKYYKVELKHYWREPIQIMGAGIYTYSRHSGQSQSIPDAVVTQREDGNRSIVDLHFDGKHYIDQLLLEVDGPEMYLRAATLQRKDGASAFTNVKEFQLSSKSLAKLDLEGNRGQDWRILIENKDDKPINIAGAQARQSLQKIRLKLPASGATLVMGDESMHAPEYDLAYFANDLPRKLPNATVGDIVDLQKPVVSAGIPDPNSPKVVPSAPTSPVVEAVVEKPFYQTQTFLWIGIGLIAVVIGGMSIMLLKDMKKPD